MKNKRILGYLIVITIALLLVFLFFEKSDLPSQVIYSSQKLFKKKKPETTYKLNQNSISILYVDPKKKTEDQPSDFFIHYFNNVLSKNESVKKMYDLISQEPGQTEAKKLIAIYFAEFTARNQSAEFSLFMNQLHQNLIINSEEIFNELISKYQFYSQNSLMNQISMNLIMQLNIPPKDKVQFMSRTLSKKIELDKSGKIISDLSNISISLALLKGQNIQLGEYRNIINESLKKHQNNPVAVQEFKMRLTTYFPDYYKEVAREEK